MWNSSRLIGSPLTKAASEAGVGLAVTVACASVLVGGGETKTSGVVPGTGEVAGVDALQALKTNMARTIQAVALK